jgi:membrane protein required for colicin V production
MLIDIVAVALLVMALFKGLSKGLIIAVFSFLAFIIGLAAALKLSALAAAYIGTNVDVSQRWLPTLAFFLVFFVVVLLVRLGAKFLEGVARIAMLGWLNKLGGFVFYLLLYLFIFSILLFYGSQLHLIKPETAEASVSYGYIQPLAPKIMSGLGAVIPIFKNMFDDLLNFFQNASHKNPSVSDSFLHNHVNTVTFR